jgi:thiamine biosynthesis lipoprotein
LSRSEARTLRVEQIWGTAIGVDVRDPITDALLDEVFDWFRQVDDVFSTWRDETEIRRLGRGELRRAEASNDVRTVLALCDRVTEESRGAFDITFGGDPRVAPREGFAPLDPSGLVKGWALDRAAEQLEQAGLRNFSINAGGDVIIRGHPEPGEPWRVGIQHPWERMSVAAVVGGTDLAVATSGRYERGEHVIDPRTGTHPHGLMSVTVIGGELALADGYATAAVVLGDEGMQWLADLDGVHGMGITDDRTIVTTAGFDRYRLA